MAMCFLHLRYDVFVELSQTHICISKRIQASCTFAFANSGEPNNSWVNLQGTHDIQLDLTKSASHTSTVIEFPDQERHQAANAL